MKFILSALVAVAATAAAHAGEVDVLDVKATKAGDGTYRFSVTLKHADEGWDHYANKWEVVGPNGKVLATRVLGHPHVNEQPFARSKSGVKIPGDIKQVTVRGGDSVHGTGGKEMIVEVN